MKKKIHNANPELTDGQIQAMLRRWFVEVEGTVKVGGCPQSSPHAALLTPTGGLQACHLRTSRSLWAGVGGGRGAHRPKPCFLPHSNTLGWLVRRGGGHFFAAHSITQQTHLNTHYIPDTALGPEDMAVKGRCSSCPHTAHHLEGETG